MSSPPAGEFGLIAELAKIFGAAPPAVVLGIGDDCAALDLGGADFLLWTIDTLVEGVHFDLGYTSLRQVGRKSLAVNLSDIAAMGGIPQYALLSLGWPPHRDLEQALEVGLGLAELAREYQVAVIGGDTVASPGGVAITVAVLGRVPKGEMLTRAGAGVGEEVYVTGPLGEAAAGLEVLRHGLDLPAELAAPLLRAHLDPVPQVGAGRLVAAGGLATAMIDLSDGVASDLGHLCRLSGVGARLAAEAVPVPAGVQAVAAALGQDPLTLALTGGEDYQLLFTSPHPPAVLASAFTAAGLPSPQRLGVTEPGREVVLQGPSGERVITGRGYDHFRLDRRPAGR